MYFKVSMRTNPDTKIYSGYYRLVESYRNHEDRVCHGTILNAGYLDELTTDQLNLIQKTLTLKASNHDQPLFELPFIDDPTAIHYVDKFYNLMVAEKRIDVLAENKEKLAQKAVGIYKRLISLASGIRMSGKLARNGCRTKPWPNCKFLLFSSVGAGIRTI